MAPRGRPLTRPWAVLIRDRVRAEGCVPVEDLLSDAARLVPPGMAFRRRAALNEAMGRFRGGQVTSSTTDSLIYLGRRHIIQTSLKTMTRTGRIAITGNGANRVVCIGPNPWPEE